MTRPLNVTAVGWAYDPDLEDEAALLNRYSTLTGWSEALLSAGADRVTVVHRFTRDTAIVQNGVTYVFVRDHDLGRQSGWGVSSRIARAVVDTAADIVHINGLSFPIQTWWLRQLLPRSTALVVQDHASGTPAPPETWSAWARAALRRRLMRAPDGFLFTAIEQADVWRRDGAIGDRQQIHAVLEGSTRMAPIEQSLARHMSGVSGDPSVLWVGRLNANKDPLCAIDGFDRLLSRAPSAALTMVYAEEDLLPLVRRHIEGSARLATRVRLVGHVPRCEMASFYSAADIFLLGSHHEGSGYALVEACACGAAPAVTSIAPFRAITGDGSIGCLWTAGDPSECARALAALSERRTGSQRADVLRHFSRTLSWDAVGRCALAAYGEVIRHRRMRVARAPAERRSDPA